ncbi:MAG: amino acid adenylation domain-containing protein [Candidatus Aminicenantes bacterium]|nr:amino acid adenylation domain-containing protein [Candidatus Aminicenantes bacterium]
MIIEKFTGIVERFPTKTAIKTNNKSLTYAELNIDSDRVAHAIAQMDKERKQARQVALLFDYGSDMMVGLLGALKAGKAYVPLDPSYPGKRLLYILENSRSNFILTDKKNFPLAQELSDHAETQIQVINIETMGAGTEAPGAVPCIDGACETAVDKTAYILYTSGSTGKPKGVYQTHRNVLYYARNWIDRVQVTEKDRVSLFTAFTHDGAIPDIYSALLSGACLYPYSMKENGSIDALAGLLDNEEITIWHSTPTLFRYFTGNLTDHRHFPQVRRVLLGGEPVRAHDLELYKTYFPGASFINIYGQTESTVSSLCFVGPRRTFDDISIGEPLDETKIYLMDDDGDFVEELGGGEIVVVCDYVAPGYWQDKENTDLVFLHDEQKGRLYRTGDTGYYTPEGTIKILGRKDFQVKIRGFRIELGEIETALLQHYAVTGAIVSAKTDENNEPYLCAYIVCNQAVSSEDMREYLFAQLPDYMVPRYFIFLEKMPLTSSGKIDRRQLPEPGKALNPGSAYEAPANEIEEKIAAIWQEVLKIAKIGINDNFIELGGHSLLIMSIIARIHRGLNVELQLTDLFDNPTIRELSRLVAAAEQTAFSAVEPVEKKEYYPLSSAQKRLFFLEQLDNIGGTYNMPLAVILDKEPDKAKIAATMQAVIDRHESLRTSFRFIDNEPVQRVHPHAQFEIEEYRYKSGGIEEIVKAYSRPFDLARPPLLRVGTAPLPDGKFLLMLEMHHIIADGASMSLLLKDFGLLYRDANFAELAKLPPLAVQYKDFTSWQNNLFSTGGIEKQKKYWLDIYSDAAPSALPKLELPADYPRPAVFSFEGDNYHFELSGETFAAFKRFCLENNVSTFMCLLTVYSTLLFKYTAQEDIIIGSDITDRPHVDLEPIIGMFVNELALRLYPGGNKSFSAFLNEIKETGITAFENRDYQFEELVDRLQPERDTSRNPLFDTQFACQVVEDAQIDLDGITGVPYHYKNYVAKFDLSFDVFEEKNRLGLRFQYYTKLFKTSTIEAMTKHLLNILGAVIEKPGLRLYDIPMMEESEKQRILFQFNNTKKEFARDKSFPGLFEEQVEKTPSGTAAQYKNQFMSYEELDKKADRLAHYLYHEKHIRPNDRVGIYMNRSLHYLIAILGIMKAGAAYIPIEPFLPFERVKQIIQDAETPVVISQARYLGAVNRLQWECPGFHSFLIMDTGSPYNIDTDTELDLKSAAELWNYVGETATDEITEGGWLTGYTGAPFTREEMAEYSANTLKKLTPFLHKNMRVLEIGCASGLTMYPIAPHVGFYYGTDISRATIEKNKQRVREGNYTNIALECIPAHEIDKINEGNFHLIIINSVIQSFPGHNYLRHVLAKAINLAAEKAILYIGDVMDQDLKQDLTREMIAFKQANKEKDYQTKIDWSNELFVSRTFFEDLTVDFPAIEKVEFSNKIYTIENELTKFRFDAILTIDKNQGRERETQIKKKRKYQDGFNHLNNNELKSVPTVSAPSIPADLAYVIYTSGSTGQPKGVLIHQQGMINHLYAKINDLSITGEDIIAQTAPAGFDISVWQFLAALLVGGMTHIIDKETVLEPMEFLKELQQGRVTILESVPSLMTVFLDVVGTGRSNTLNHLRWMLATGEPLTPPLARKWYSHYPAVKLLNAYGPTEASDDITHHIVAVLPALPAETQFNIPVGKPLRNLQIYILDKNLSLCPVGVRGEICVAGIGVGKGYWKDPQKTATSFISNPFLDDINDPNYAVLYRTGDTGYFAEDGTIYCLGRIDNQVKIRGNRIELEEIEKRLLEHPRVKETVIIVRGGSEKEAGEKELHAYITNNAAAGTADDAGAEAHLVALAEQLRDYLSGSLPDYMIPARFIPIEQIPLTPNGKIDRKALEKMGEVLNSNIQYAPPATEMEKTLAKIWQELLKLDRVGIHDDFFQLGGNSLTAITVASALKKARFNVSLIDIITAPTLAKLALLLEEKNKEEIPLIGKLKCIEKLNNGHGKKNLFIVHPQHGMVYQYKEFALLLEREYNVYGLQALGVGPGTQMAEGPRQMIDRYLEEILAVQDSGPYIIGGYCVGSLVGYEIARRLERMGYTVEKLLLFDSRAFITPVSVGILRTMEKLPRFLKQIALALTYNRGFAKAVKTGKYQRTLEQDGREIADPKLRKETIEKYMDILIAHVVPLGIIKAPLLSVLAEAAKHDLKIEEGFNRMTKSKATVIRIPGDHDSIFERPYVERLAEVIIKEGA